MANWRGAWASGTAYIAGDSVSYSGTSYYCVTACTGQVPSSSGDWAAQDSFEGPATGGGGGGITPPAGDIGGSAGTPTVTGTHLSSPLPVAQGGTNATTAGAALTSLGAAPASALTTETSRAEVAEALLAPLASPALTGTPTAPTKTALTNTTALATTQYADSAVAAEVTNRGTAVTTEATARTTAIGVETTRAEAAEALLAPLASPALTGTPTAPTATALTSSTVAATTAYADSAVATEVTARTTAIGVETTRAEAAEALLAPLASPSLTGTPAAPTKTALTNSTALATTAYTDTAVGVETTRATAADTAGELTALAYAQSGGLVGAGYAGAMSNFWSGITPSAPTTTWVSGNLYGQVLFVLPSLTVNGYVTIAPWKYTAGLAGSYLALFNSSGTRLGITADMSIAQTTSVTRGVRVAVTGFTTTPSDGIIIAVYTNSTSAAAGPYFFFGQAGNFGMPAPATTAVRPMGMVLTGPTTMPSSLTLTNGLPASWSSSSPIFWQMFLD